MRSLVGTSSIRRGIRLGAIALLLAGVLAAGCTSAPPPAPTAAPAPKPAAAQPTAAAAAPVPAAQPTAAAAAPVPAAQPTAAAAAPAPAAAPKPSQYDLGFVSQMTGTAAYFHTQVQPAAEMAAKEINAKGGVDGVPIKMNWEDGQVDPRVAVTAAQKLIDVYKVPVLISSGSSVVLALHPLAKDQKKLLVNVGAVSPQLRKVGAPLISFIPTADAASPTLASLLVDKLGLKETALIQVDNDFGTDSAKAFVDAFTQKGGKVIASEKNAVGATDMRTQLIKLKGANPKALVVLSNQGEDGTIVKQAKEVGLNAQILSDTNMTTDDNFKIAGDAMNGVIGVRVVFDPQGSQQAKDYTDRYRKEANKEPDIYSAITYDVVNVLAMGIKAAGFNGEALYKYMLTVKDYQGAMGNTTIGQDGIVSRPPTAFKIDGGKVVDYK